MNITAISTNAQLTQVGQAAAPKPVDAPEVKPVGGVPSELASSPDVKEETTAGNQEDMAKQVRDAADSIEKFVAQTTRDITFSFDQNEQFLVKVIDRDSQTVIRQIPSEEVIAIAKALDKLQGLFVQDKI